MINFNIPFTSKDAILKLNKQSNFVSYGGNGYWTKKTQRYLENKFKFKKVFLTNSCTSALEISALCLKLKKSDEVIIPSYAYPTTASAFLRCGYKIRFVDSNKDNPRIDKKDFLKIVNKNTKAVVIVHQAGQLEDIDFFLKQKKKYGFKIIEDAAQALNLKHKLKFAGSFGDFGCISFHESKNLHCGLGGMLIVNNKKDEKISQIIWERGTNRSLFEEKKVSKYSWKEIGSNFYLSELQSLFLFFQLKKLKFIQKKRAYYFKIYSNIFKRKTLRSHITDMDTSISTNYHMRYILLKNKSVREKLIKFLKKNNISSVSHYEPLHLSKVGMNLDRRKLKNAKQFSERVLRLPIHTFLNKSDLDKVEKKLIHFFKTKISS